MADDYKNSNDNKFHRYVDPSWGPNVNMSEDNEDYTEETAAEVAPFNYGPARNVSIEEEDTKTVGGTGLGWLALALSIISLFVMPVLMGAAGIIIGFIARRRGATGLGAWAIGIGAISIIVGIFILPFF